MIIFIIVRLFIWFLNRGDPHVFRDLAHMAEETTDVVRVEIVSLAVEELQPRFSDRTYAYTVYTVRILEMFQGDLQVGDEVEIVQQGERSLWNRRWISISVGDDLVLFFRTRPDFPASMSGVYRLSRNVPSDVAIDTSIRLRPIRSRGLPGDGIRVTVEELWDLRED